MTNKKPLLVSGALNLVLVAVLWAMASRGPKETGATQAVPGAVESKKTTNPGRLARTNEGPELAAGSGPKSAQRFDWQVVESEDYRKYIANLRAIGCPEETIRDIITADVNKLYESRRKALTGSTNKFQFWKAGNPLAGMFDPTRLEKTQELTTEKRALLKELLGVVPEEKPDLLGGFNPYETLLDFLSSDKQSQVISVQTKYQTKLMKSLQSGGTPDAEDVKQMLKVQKDMEAELATVLSPQEFDDYQLRMSQTAMMMRMQLGDFDPSEQEFRNVFKARKDFDDTYGPGGMFATDKDTQEKKTAADKAMKDSIKATLGDDRYAEYERAQDYSYQAISKVVQRQGLAKDAGVKAYDMKKAAEDQANQVRKDQNLSADQRTTALKGIRAETERSLTEVLGAKGFESYNSQNTAFWLKAISPDPKPTGN